MGLYEFKEDDAYRFANHVHIQAYERGEELWFRTCPFCHGKGKSNEKTFSINLKTGQFNCFRASCKRQGNMVDLAREFDFSLGNNFDEYYNPKKQFRKLNTPKEPIKPKDPAIAYLNKRGISKAIAERYQLTCQTEHPNILCFPFIDENGIWQFVKYRKMDFDKTRDKNKEWCEKDCKPILFGMYQCNLENKTLVITEGQCFDGKAEILTPDGWIRFEDYAGQDVLQVNGNMQGSFVRPKQYIVKRHIGQMVHVEIGGNYETYTTDDHNLVFIDKHGDVVKKKAIEKIPVDMHIPTTITINDNSHSNWTDDMFALYIAISADGTIDYRKGTGYLKPWAERYVRIAIPIERKIKRMREILNNLGIKYSDNTDNRGYQSICFPCPDWLKSKYLPYWFATETTIEQKRFILEEMSLWDGNNVNGRNQYEYTTILKHNADVMQLISTTCGYMSTVMSKQSGGNGAFKKGYVYKVSILLRKHEVSTQPFEKNKTISNVDQRVYCVTVDTGMILVRQNNRISVSGNCDSLSVSECNIENAVSVPTGANGFTWIPYCWNWVNQFEKIIVFGDHEKGHITLLDDIKKRFKAEIYHVREEDYKDCKDANEILLKYGKDQIRACIDNAVRVPLDYAIDFADIEDVNIYEIEKLKTGIKVIDFPLYGGFPFPGLVIVTGKRSEGKSTLTSQIIANAVNQGYKCMAYSGELAAWQFKAWMMKQIAGNKHTFLYQNKSGEEGYEVSKTNKEIISRWIRDKLFVLDNSKVGSNDTIGILEAVENTIQQYGVRVILLDNLMTAISAMAEKSSEKYEMQSQFTKKITEIAMKYNVIIILVAHKKKNTSGIDEMDDILGSSDVVNLASVVLSYGRNSEIGEDQRMLKLLKNRLFGKVNFSGWLMDFDEKSNRIYGEGDDVSREFEWTKLIQNEQQPSAGFVDANEEIPFD